MFLESSDKEYDLNLFYCVSLPGFTWWTGIKYTNINLQKLQDKNMFLLFENNFRGGTGSVLEDSFVKPDENMKDIVYRPQLFKWMGKESKSTLR